MTNKLFDSPPGAPSPIRGPVDLSRPVAGEEDPGATIEPAASAGATRSGGPAGPPAPMRPGDEAPAGTPGTGEDVCPACGGAGRLSGRACPACQGSGRVNRGIGGG
jgi:hypothetical protein